MNENVSNFTKGLLNTMLKGAVTGLGMQIGHAVYDQLKESYPRLKTDVYPALMCQLQSLKTRLAFKASTDSTTAN